MAKTTSPSTARKRKCTHCGKTKFLASFPVAERKNSCVYYRHVCKECRVGYERGWREENKVHFQAYRSRYYKENQPAILQRVKKWQIDNREYKLAYQRAWYLANSERLKAKQRNYNAENPEVAKAYREKNKEALSRGYREWRLQNRPHILRYAVKWRTENRDHARAYAIAYNKKNPETKRLSEAKRRARKRGGEGKVTVNELMNLFKTQRGKCTYCSIALKGNFQIDHIIPLARGGLHLLSNLQLLCPPCNRHKHAKTHDEYLLYLSKIGNQLKAIISRSTRTRATTARVG